MVLGKWLHLFFAASVLIVSSLAITGCNTTRGVGQDIKATGDAIEDTAEDAQQLGRSGRWAALPPDRA